MSQLERIRGAGTVGTVDFSEDPKPDFIMGRERHFSDTSHFHSAYSNHFCSLSYSIASKNVVRPKFVQSFSYNKHKTHGFDPCPTGTTKKSTFLSFLHSNQV